MARSDEGYLTYGGDTYGNSTYDPLVTHCYDEAAWDRFLQSLLSKFIVYFLLDFAYGLIGWIDWSLDRL